MSLLPSVAARITVEATRYRSAVSEFLVQSLGKSINYLLDKNDLIVAALSALPVSQVTDVYVTAGTTATYNVPADYVFIGSAYSYGNATSGTLIISGGTENGSFTAPGGLVTSVPLKAGAGATISATLNTGGGGTTGQHASIVGVIIKQQTIVIP